MKYTLKYVQCGLFDIIYKDKQTFKQTVLPQGSQNKWNVTSVSQMHVTS